MEEIEKSEPDYKELLYIIGTALSNAEYYRNANGSERWDLFRDHNEDALQTLRIWFKQEKTIRDNQKALIAAQAKTKLTDEELAALGLKR